MRLRKLLEQKDFGRIEGVPAVACRAIARSATADPSRFFQRPAAQEVTQDRHEQLPLLSSWFRRLVLPSSRRFPPVKSPPLPLPSATFVNFHSNSGSAPFLKRSLALFPTFFANAAHVANPVLTLHVDSMFSWPSVKMKNSDQIRRQGSVQKLIPGDAPGILAAREAVE